jgi:hypothetical protein
VSVDLHQLVREAIGSWEHGSVDEQASAVLSAIVESPDWHILSSVTASQEDDPPIRDESVDEAYRFAVQPPMRFFRLAAQFDDQIISGECRLNRALFPHASPAERAQSVLDQLAGHGYEIRRSPLLIVDRWHSECNACGYGHGGWASSPAHEGKPILTPESKSCPECLVEFTHAVDPYTGKRAPIEREPQPGHHLPPCPAIAGSILTLEISYTLRAPEQLLEQGLRELDWLSRTWRDGPRGYRTRFEGPYSDDAVRLIRAAIPALGVIHADEPVIT